MSPFVIYTFDVSKKNTPLNLFTEEMSTRAEIICGNLSPLEMFENLFPKQGQSMDLKIPGHDNGNRIEQNAGQIIIFRLQADKTKIVDNKYFKKQTVEHKPSGRIVVDLRPGKQLILIEKKSDALKPQDAIVILQSAFNHLLAESELQFNFQQYNLKSDSFWNTVDVIKKITNTTVRRVQFDFVQSAEPQDNDPLALASSIIPVDEADHGSIILESDSGKDLAFIQRRRDMEHMIHLCSQQGYNLTVFFRQFGLFRYGMDIEAQLGVDDQIIDDFIKGETYFDSEPALRPTTIFAWLDKCLEIITKNGERVNGIPTAKKRKTKN